MADLVSPRFAAVIARELGIHVDDVKPQALIAADLKADSIDAVCLVVALEDEFSVELPDSVIADMKNGSILDLVAVVDAAQADRQPKEAVHG